MSDALYALSSHAPLSKLMPTWPFKSARPRLSMRPARVTSPAPVTTPKMPSRGRVDTSDGMAAAAVRAISKADGRTVMLEAAICSSSPSRAHSCNHRNSGTQFRREGRILQRDLDRNTLHDFREVASGVVGGHTSELGSGGWCYLDPF